MVYSTKEMAGCLIVDSYWSFMFVFHLFINKTKICLSPTHLNISGQSVGWKQISLSASWIVLKLEWVILNKDKLIVESFS